MRLYKLAILSLLFTGLISLNAHAGTITGVVKFKGKAAPAPKELKFNKDQKVCGNGTKDTSLIVSKGLGVENAVVSIKGIKTDKKPAAPKGKIQFVQQKCMFHPRVLLIPTNTVFDILNKDPLTHNIHTFGRENPTINKGQPKTTPVINFKFDVPERIKVKCDIHKWMSAWFQVVDNPYTVLTGADGSFKITDVPPGTYDLSAWHEDLSPGKQSVTIKGNEEVKVTFEMPMKKKRGRRR
jgi:hypothetical protein